MDAVSDPTFSVVVPVFNEEGNVEALARRVVAVMENLGETFVEPLHYCRGSVRTPQAYGADANSLDCPQHDGRDAQQFPPAPLQHRLGGLIEKRIALPNLIRSHRLPHPVKTIANL